MALPTSGSLSLDAIHVEAGGTSATHATINDTDIRGLIGKTAATHMTFNEWYGASAQGIGADWPYNGAGVVDFKIWPVDARAGFWFESDGTYDAYSPTHVSYDYLTSTGAGEGANFYIKYVKNSGLALNGSTNLTDNGAYVAISSQKILERYVTGLSTGATNVTIYIAEDSSGTGVVSWTGNITAEVEN